MTPYSARSASSGSRHVSEGSHKDPNCPSGYAYDGTNQCVPGSPDIGRVPARCCNPPEPPEPDDFPPIMGGPYPGDVVWPAANTHGLGGRSDPFRMIIPHGWPPPIPNLKLNYRKDDLRRNIIACAPASTVTETKVCYVMGTGYSVYRRGWNIGIKGAELPPTIDRTPTKQLSWYFDAPIGQIASGIDVNYIAKQYDGQYKNFAKCSGSRLGP